MNDEYCPVCYSKRAQLAASGSRVHVLCPVCGQFEITYSASSALDDLTSGRTRVHILIGMLRQVWESGTLLTLDTYNIASLIESARLPRTPMEAIDRVLLWIHRRTDSFAKPIRYNPNDDYPVVFARDGSEFSFLLTTARDLGWLELPSAGNARLTLDGWRRVVDLQRTSTVSDQAFVAMWFNAKTKDLWDEGIRPALEATGFTPVRIDLVQHNDKIDDRIVAEIRRSGLLVADFTGHRGGVYFEAGLALGLGLPVIWMCSADDIEDLHFDTRQYNHIVWADPAEALERLKARIVASGFARYAR